MRIIDNLTLLLLYYQKDFNNSSREDLVKGRRSETLAAISTPETLNLFKVIAVTNKSRDDNASRTEANLTNKQHYLRIAKLTKAGLVTRNGREYFLTSYGKIVYHNLTRLETTLTNY
jgi:predicted transcriptional regulator